MTDHEENLELWKRYKQHGDTAARSKLLERLNPYIQQRVSLYKDVPIPVPAIHAHALMRTLHALDTFKPDKGAQLTTHVVNELQGVSRFVNQNKNVARIPEHRFLRIGTFNAVHDSLNAQLGRPPSIEELADELAWPHHEVQTMAQSLKARALSASAMPEAAEGGLRDRSHETMSFVRFGLTPLERQAFDHMYGYNNKPLKSIEEIAKLTGMSTDTLYRLRRRTAQDILRNS